MKTDKYVSLGNGHTIGTGSSPLCNSVETITPSDTNSSNGVSPSHCPNPEKDKKWFLMRASYGREQKVCAFLQEQGIEVFCPKWKQERIYAGKKTIVEVSIIPNTLFVKSTESILHEYVGKEPLSFFHHYYMYDVDEKRQKKGLGRKPITIPESQMNSFICWVETDNSDKIIDKEGQFNFKAGDKVRVSEGDFEGFTGYVMRFKGQTRVGITIDNVGTIFTAYIPKKLLIKINNQ